MGSEKKAERDLQYEYKRHLKEQEQIWGELRSVVMQSLSEFDLQVEERKERQLKPLAKALAKARPSAFSYTVIY